MNKHARSHSAQKRLSLFASFGFMAIIGLLAPCPVFTQTCDLAPFLATNSWTGSIAITGSGSGTVPIVGGHTDYQITQSITLAPVMTVNPQGNTWLGPQNASIKVNETAVTSYDGIPGTTTHTITADGFTALGPSGVGALLTFVAPSCAYNIVADTTFLQFYEDGQLTGGDWGWLSLPQPIPAPVWNATLPTSGTNLSGSLSFDAAVSYTVVTTPSGFGPVLHWTVTWSVSPTTDLDVVVKIPSYSTWRPTGGLNEIETGLDPALKFNFLEIQAQLIRKSTKQVVDFSPDKWTFSLVDVSQEPGVVMNWPAKTLAGNKPDMSFDKQACATPLGCDPIPENALYDTSDPRNAVLTSGDPFSFASVQILLSPHDWGGWATLNVIATVGGNAILGHLELDPPLVSNPNETEILLPQRQAGSFIADSWKTAHGVALSTLDTDDSENHPSGDGQPGDGITLYEEYRGFYMGCTASDSEPQPEGTGGCQRVEGDPAKKDLFVVDTIPTIAGDGLQTFKKATGVNLHYLDMTTEDADPLPPPLLADRIINFNHAAGPHEVDQHALVIELGDQEGFSVAEPVPGRDSPGLPKDILAIRVDHAYRNYSADYIRRMVAHELSHSVDVYHHGDIDSAEVTWKVDSNGNISEDGQTIYVKTEDEDPSILKTTVPLGVLGFGQNLSKVDVWVGNNVCPNTSNVVVNGQHSGDQFSYMRYVAAEAYIPMGFPQIRYWTGDEVIGFDLTDHPQGTG